MAKAKITWINFLHIYQPPWQDQGVIEQIAAESYEYLVSLLRKYPKYKLTLNITGNLVDQLEIFRPDILHELVSLQKKGQIELTGSAKYHPLLPLIRNEEAARQIKLNKETLAKHFDSKKISGFYLPEMAYSNEVARLVKKAGYKWLILDPIAAKKNVREDTQYSIKNINLKVVFRDRNISKAYPPEEIFNMLKNDALGETVISAHDGETYGHFHEDWQGHIEKVISNRNVVTKTVSEHLASLKKKDTIVLRNSTWETTNKDLSKNQPWMLWKDPKNRIHMKLWALAELAQKMNKKYKNDEHWKWSRMHLDRGLSSCSFWWSTAKKPSPFSSVTWSPDMIDNGAEELVRSIRSLASAKTRQKVKAEKLYLDIKKNTWLTHWKKYHK